MDCEDSCLHVFTKCFTLKNKNKIKKEKKRKTTSIMILFCATKFFYFSPKRAIGKALKKERGRGGKQGRVKGTDSYPGVAEQFTWEHLGSTEELCSLRS